MLRGFMLVCALGLVGLTLAGGRAAAQANPLVGQDSTPPPTRASDVAAASGFGMIDAPSAADYKKAYDDGLIAIAQQDWKRAVRRFGFVAKGFPNDPDVQAYLGFSAVRLGDPKKAEKAFAKALKIDPQHLRANAAYGQYLVSQNRRVEAQARLDVLNMCCAKASETQDLAAAIAAAPPAAAPTAPPG